MKRLLEGLKLWAWVTGIIGMCIGILWLDGLAADRWPRVTGVVDVIIIVGLLCYIAGWYLED